MPATAVEHLQAEQTPPDKIVHLRELHRTGRRVLMVGHGINDVAALAAASA